MLTRTPRCSSAASHRGGARKPRLVLGLGNPLMGDDGIGWHVVEALRGDPGLPADVEVLWGGTDLLGCGELLRDRGAVVLVDAMEAAEAGTVHWLDLEAAGEEALPDGEAAAAGAHTLSLVAALSLLRCAEPDLAHLDLRLLGVGVTSVEVGERLSPPLGRRLPGIVDRVLAALAAP